jgi:hypothetical protein
MSVGITLILAATKSRSGMSLFKRETYDSRSSRFPFLRGRRLLLEYKDGSKCEGNQYRTSIISFLCDRDLDVNVIAPIFKTDC